VRDLRKHTPHAWAIEGYHDIIVRDESLTAVLPVTGVLLAFAAVFFAVGAARFR
jgi:ABC-2 type transport system permease protein